jgi:hypothetical protein
VRGRGGRAAAIGECGFNGFRYEVKNEGGRRGVGQALFDGEWRRYGRCFASSTVEHGRASHGRARRGGAGQANGGSGGRGGRQARERSSGLQVLVGRTLWWASEEKSGKWDERAIKATRTKLVWATMRNRKCFQILIQRNEIQI